MSFKTFFVVVAMLAVVLSVPVIAENSENSKLRGLSLTSLDKSRSTMIRKGQPKQRQLRMQTIRKYEPWDFETSNTSPSPPNSSPDDSSTKINSSATTPPKVFEELPTTFNDNNGMNTNFLEIVMMAAKLSQMIYWENITSSTTFLEFEMSSSNQNVVIHNSDDTTADTATASTSKTTKASTKVWIDEPDKAVVASIGNLCFGIFRGSIATREDWEQNLNTNEKTVCTPPLMTTNEDEDHESQCCTSREGFSDAYTNPAYFQEFEAELRACASGDDGHNRNVILTGASQGGAIAMVATVYLADLNPAIITFAQPPAIEDPCAVIDSSRAYRFVNTILNDQNKLVYDPVPFLPTFRSISDQQGHMFILGPTEEDSASSTQQVAYYPDDEAPQIGTTDWSIRQISEVHSMESYLVKLEMLFDQSRSNRDSTATIQMNGWGIGSKCTLDSQCTSPHICSDWNDECSNGQSGIDTCGENKDCLSGRCEGLFQPKCQDKLPRKSWCNENSDCINGDCRWNWKCN